MGAGKQPVAEKLFGTVPVDRFLLEIWELARSPYADTGCRHAALESAANSSP